MEVVEIAKIAQAALEDKMGEDIKEGFLILQIIL